MGVRMILHLMPALQHLGGQLFVAAKPAAVQKKGDLYLFLIQDVQHRDNVLVAPGHIDHQRYHRFRRIAPVDRLSPQVIE
ncbi:hypothetical protein D3C86_2047510 [compost metagenome]